MSREKGEITYHNLDMRRLVQDFLLGKLAPVSMPTEYLRATRQVAMLATAKEKLEESLIEFFKNFLDTRKKDGEIAEKYGMTEEDVTSVRDSWHVALVRYYV